MKRKISWRWLLLLGSVLIVGVCAVVWYTLKERQAAQLRFDAMMSFLRLRPEAIAHESPTETEDAASSGSGGEGASALDVYPKARRRLMIEELKSMFLIGSPPYRRFEACVEGSEEDCKRTVDSLREQCERLSAEACDNLATLLAFPQGLIKGIPRNDVQAAKYTKQACSLGQQSACAELGTITYEGLGVPRDRQKGLALMKEACQADVLACGPLKIYLDPDRERKNAEARKRFKEEYDCEQGDEQACTRLAAIQEKSCEAGSDNVCGAMCGGFVVKSQQGITLQQALNACQRACDHGGMVECAMLGLLYTGKRGAPVNHRRAAALFKKACDQGEETGCSLGRKLKR